MGLLFHLNHPSIPLSFLPPSLFHPLSLRGSPQLLWESTHNALWGNCPIMNTALLNWSTAAGRNQTGRWNIHKALLTLLFLADALRVRTVGDNHAVPLGCTVYGNVLTIRPVDIQPIISRDDGWKRPLEDKALILSVCNYFVMRSVSLKLVFNANPANSAWQRGFHANVYSTWQIIWGVGVRPDW